MKNRRLAIIAFVLVAVMAIGVGYATMNDNLVATGSAKASLDTNAFDSKVVFTGAEVKADGTTISTATGMTAKVKDDGDELTNGDTITINVPADYFTKLNDQVTITVTVANTNEDIAVWVENVVSVDETNSTSTTVDDTAYFDITTTAAKGMSVDAKGTTTFDVVIKLIKTPDYALDCGFTIELDITTDKVNP